MNIFEFLGLPINHRAENKIFQYVKHFDEVNKKADEGIFHKKVAFPIFGQKKEDGVFCAVVKRFDGTVGLFNRTGKMMTNCEHLKVYYENVSLPIGIFIGEMLSPYSACSLEELSGVINPNRVNPLKSEQLIIRDHLLIKFFDHLTLQEFDYGESHLRYSERHNALFNLIRTHSLIIPYQVLNGYEELLEYTDQMISHGYEGAVFKQDVGYLCGAKDWHQMKKVRDVEFDLECIGWEEGTGKYKGHVVNLLFRFKDGKTVKAMLGKGWTMKDAKDMFDSEMHSNGYKVVGQIYKVYGLQPSSKNGLIRLPKVGELRHDKVEGDF